MRSVSYTHLDVYKRQVLGYHEHHGETETYYILSGNGVYVDNGEEVPAKEGDVFFCKDGDGPVSYTHLVVVNAVFTVLVILGVVTDHTTRGMKDSTQALTCLLYTSIIYWRYYFNDYIGNFTDCDFCS